MNVDWSNLNILKYPQMGVLYNKPAFISYDKILFEEFHRFMAIAFEEHISRIAFSRYVGFFVSTEELEQIEFIIQQLGIVPVIVSEQCGE